MTVNRGRMITNCSIKLDRAAAGADCRHRNQPGRTAWLVTRGDSRVSLQVHGLRRVARGHARFLRRSTVGFRRNSIRGTSAPLRPRIGNLHHRRPAFLRALMYRGSGPWRGRTVDLGRPDHAEQAKVRRVRCVHRPAKARACRTIVRLAVCRNCVVLKHREPEDARPSARRWRRPLFRA